MQPVRAEYEETRSDNNPCASGLAIPTVDFFIQETSKMPRLLHGLQEHPHRCAISESLDSEVHDSIRRFSAVIDMT